MFGIVGFPSIYQTDNGMEVCGKEIIKLLMANNPHITTVQGRPRKPRDQGSVENANKSIRNIVQSYVAEEWSKGNRNFNWTMALGRAMTALNGSIRRTGTTPMSAYQTVFGVPFFNHFQGAIGYSSSELRDGETPLERCLNTGSIEIAEHYAKDGELTVNDIEELGDLATERVRSLIQQNSTDSDMTPEDEVFKTFRNSDWSNIPDEFRPHIMSSGQLTCLPCESAGEDTAESDTSGASSSHKRGKLLISQLRDRARQKVATSMPVMSSSTDSDDEDTYNEDNEDKPFYKSDKSSQVLQAFPRKSDKSPHLSDKLTHKHDILPQKSDKSPHLSHRLAHDSNVPPQRSHKSPQGSNVLSQMFDKLPQASDISPQVSDILPQETDKSSQVSDILPQETDKSSQVSDILPQETNKSAQVSDILPQETDKSPQVSDESPLESHGLSHESNLLPRASDKSTQASNVLPQKSDISPQVSDISPQETDKSSQVSDILPQETDKSSQVSDILPQETNKSARMSDKLPLGSDKSPQVSDKLLQESDKTPKVIDKLPQISDNLHQVSNVLPQESDKLLCESNTSPPKSDKLTEVLGKSSQDHNKVVSGEEIVVMPSPQPSDRRHLKTIPLANAYQQIIASGSFVGANRKDKFIVCHLTCKDCSCGQSTKVLQVPSGQCLQHYFSDRSQKWLPHSLVHSFGTLVEHYFHNRTILFHNSTTNYSKADLSEMRKWKMKTYNLKDQDPYVKEIISLGFGKSHYVVIHIDIDKKKIDVYDGMSGGNDLSLWNKSALATLWYYELLQQADSNVRPVHCLQTDDSHSSSAFWTIAYDTRMMGIQKDSHSCGVLASLSIMYLMRPVLKNPSKRKDLHPSTRSEDTWRSTVGNIFKKIIIKAWKNLNSALRQKFHEEYTSVGQTSLKEQYLNYLSGFMDTEKTEEPTRRSQRNQSKK